MANSLKTPIWYVDGTGSISTAPVMVKNLYWTGGSDGDVLQLHDAEGGNLVWKAKCVNGYDVSWDLGEVFPGLYLTAMGHGQLLIHV